MGAIVNGLALHGWRAFGAGFLIFSDYMKGSIRLAAVMRIPSIFVFTHDSIGLGEDGPTHQPIEQLATLRATPHLNVVRPAGFNETAQGLALRAHADRHADRAGALAPGPAGVGPGRRAGRRDRARRLRAPRRRGPRPDPHRLGLRGPRRRRRAQAARGRRAARAAREHAVHGPLRRAGRRPTATACCRRRCAPASRSRRRARSAGTAGSATMGDVVAMEGFGASGAGEAPLRALRLHGGGGGRARASRGERAGRG